MERLVISDGVREGDEGMRDREGTHSPERENNDKVASSRNLAMACSFLP